MMSAKISSRPAPSPRKMSIKANSRSAPELRQFSTQPNPYTYDQRVEAMELFKIFDQATQKALITKTKGMTDQQVCATIFQIAVKQAEQREISADKTTTPETVMEEIGTGIDSLFTKLKE